MRRLVPLLAVALLVGCGSGSPPATVVADSVGTTTESVVVLSPAQTILEGMTLREKASQVFLVRFKGKSMEKGDAGLLINDGPYGGFVLIEGNIGTADVVRALTTGMQQAAKATGSRLQLLITADQEGGSSGITDGVPKVPSARILANTSTPEQAESLAAGTAKGLLGLGLNMNLAPVADVAAPGNIMSRRSFGSEPGVVSSFVAAVVRGYEANGLIAVVKHFPGHGRTDGNTHNGPVSSEAGIEAFEEVHLSPFRAAIDAGTEAIMLSHIIVEAYDPDNPASRSPAIIRLLREDLDFEGLIVTDSLTMMAAQEGIGPEGACVASLKAGCDMLVAMPTAGKVMSMRNAVVAAVENGELSEERLDEAVLHVIEMKLKHGLVFE